MTTTNMKNGMYAAGFALVASTFLLTSSPSAQADSHSRYWCAPNNVQGVASRIIEKRAKRKAKAAWKSAAKRRYGFTRITWRHGAQAKSVHCSLVLGLRPSKKKCFARGIPCGWR